MSYTKTSKKGSPLNVTGRHYGVAYPSGIPYSQPFNDISTMAWTDTFTGDYNPAWRDQIRSGQNATTSASGTKTHATIDPFSGKAGYISELPYPPYWPPGRGETHTELDGTSFFIAPPSPENPQGDVITRVSNTAIRYFIRSALAAQHGALSGETIGETKKTLDSIARPLSSLRAHTLGYLTNVDKRRKGIQSRLAMTKMVADTYLEYNFGWKPLALSVADAIVAHENKGRHYDVYPVEGSGKETYSGNSQPWQPYAIGPMIVDGTYVDTNTYSVRLKGAVRSGAVNGEFSTNKTFGTTLPQFIPTLWNLLPYSFVVDYFLNVGDYLQARSFRYADLTYCVKTVRQVALRQYAVRTVRNPTTLPSYVTSRYASGSGGNSKVQVVMFTRSIGLPEDLIPRLQFQLPIGEKPWVNIGALIASRLKPLYTIFRKLK